MDKLSTMYKFLMSLMCLGLRLDHFWWFLFANMVFSHSPQDLPSSKGMESAKTDWNNAGMADDSVQWEGKPFESRMCEVGLFSWTEDLGGVRL